MDAHTGLGPIGTLHLEAEGRGPIRLDVWRRSLRLSWAKHAKALLAIGTVGGFVADVLKPLADLAAVVCPVCLALAATVWLIARQGRVNPRRGAFWTQLLVVFGLMLGLVAGAQWALNADDGVLAKLEPRIKDLQKTLGIVRDTVSRIDETTQRIENKVEDARRQLPIMSECPDARRRRK